MYCTLRRFERKENKSSSLILAAIDPSGQISPRTEKLSRISTAAQIFSFSERIIIRPETFPIRTIFPHPGQTAKTMPSQGKSLPERIRARLYPAGYSRNPIIITQKERKEKP